MRILLSEGSGLTSRQVAGRLGSLGHEVEILSSSKICLTRFTRYVSAVHDVPRFGLDPFGWLAAAKRIAGERKTDLLFPTQEQVTALSARRKYIRVATIVPPFASLARVQDKISAFRTLKAIGAPQPQTFVISTADDLRDVATYPIFVKRPVSTASSGVRRATNAQELGAAAREFGLGQSKLIAQSQASGPLAMVQAVADRGRLVAHHACLRLREGVGGGTSLKESIALPGLAEMLARLVAALDWHGALSMDLIVADSGAVSPRRPLRGFFRPRTRSRRTHSIISCWRSRNFEIPSSSGSRRTPRRISSTSAKLICRAVVRATAQLFLRFEALRRTASKP
jgi:hypothetical protein